MIAALLRRMCRRETPWQDDRICRSLKHLRTLRILSFAPSEVGGTKSRWFTESHA